MTAPHLYAVFFRIVGHDLEVSRFETEMKPWDMDERDWTTLGKEIGAFVYDDQDGHDWWGTEELEIEIFWGEGDHEGSADALQSTQIVGVKIAPVFSSRRK